MTAPPPGRLIIVSGPSGAGKSTVVRRLIECCQLPLELSVSATTRAPREGETDGKEYHFLSPERFEALRKEGAFLESKEVFSLGRWYGTLHEQVATGLKMGRWVILEIDVEGAIEVMASDLDPITLFIHPGSHEELEKRLRARGTETEQDIQARLKTAAEEMKSLAHYQYAIINDDVERAVDEICSILRQSQGT